MAPVCRGRRASRSRARQAALLLAPPPLPLGPLRCALPLFMIFKVFSEVAAELPSFIETPINVSYTSSYKDNPVAAAFGVSSIPALLYFARGSTEPTSMPIPRKRTEFTEEAVVAWIEGVLAPTT